MNRRDIELLISARETTGRSFKAVTDNITALNRKIEEQVAAAERGEGSLQDLRRSQDQLAQAGRDLSALQGQIDAYERLEAQQKKNSAASEAAVADYAKMKAELAGLENVTAAQERKLAGLERKQRTASAALEKTTTDLGLQSAALERAGVDVTRLDQAQTQIIASARQAGTGFVQLGVSIDAYSDNVRRARDAEQALAAQNVFDQKIAQARQLGDASRFVQLFTSAVGTLKASDNQLAALTGFRSVGQMAVEASRDISQFVQAGHTMAIGSQEVAQGLRAILDPGGQALRTINGIEAAIETAGAAAVAEKASVASYSNALNELSAASAAIVQQGALIDTFERQGAATAIARQQFQQAQAEVQRLGAAMASADVPTEALTLDLQKAEAVLQQTGRALALEETKLGEMSRALRAADIDTENLAAAQLRLKAAATTAAGAMGQANTILGRGGAKPGGLFGLNPYEMQNLSFQINDVVVGLASGQKPLTVLVQQGLQISQIMPGLISGIAKFTLRWFPLIGAIVAGTLALANYAKEVARIKEFQDALDLSPKGGAFDAKALSDLSGKLQDMGASAEDAKKALLSMVEEGFSPEALNKYAEAAGQLSERLGIDLPEATEMLLDVQRGGIEAAEELAGKTGDLTVAELDHADALFKAGKEAEARQYILDRVAARNAEIAEATQSKWTPAVNNLKQAFAGFFSFMDGYGQRVLNEINALINNTVIGFTFLTGLLNGKDFKTAQREAVGAVRGRPKAPRGGATGQDIRDRQFARELDAEVGASRTLTNQERLRRAETEARTRAQAAGVSHALQERAVQQAIGAEQKKITQEAERAAKKGRGAANKAEAARKRAQRQAETLARKIESTQNTLEGQLRSLDSATGRGASAPLEDRLRIVDNKYQSIFDTIQKLRDLGITSASDGTTFSDLEAQVNLSKERLKNEERIKFFEDQIALLTEQRKDEIENIADAQERGAKTVAQAYADAEAVNGRISPQIVAAAQQALTVARAIAGTKPSPEMVSMIAQLERIISGEGVTDIVNKVGLSALGDQESKLNTLLKERDDLVESIARLNELNLISDAEARQRTTDAYAAQGKAIAPVLAQLRETVTLLNQQKDALTGLPLLSDTAYNAWLAKIDAINAGLVLTDARMVEVQNAARQGIQQGVTQAFQTVADTLVGLVAGTVSWGDALNNVLTTGLSLLGSFLQAIADVLIQMVALKIAKSLIGGGFGGFLFHSGGVVGGGNGRSRSNIRGDWFGAPKFHGGGGLGLRQDEYKAVLKRGEEVLTEDDPRHVRNLGQGGPNGPAPSPSIKQVLVLDPEEIPKAMQGRSGQRTLMTFIRANKDTIKQVLG